MKQLDLREYISLCDEICRSLSSANVGNASALSRPLKDIFRDDLLAFGIFLADADKIVDEKESQIISDYLGVEVNEALLNRIKRQYNIGDNFTEKVPESLKYAVLADAGKKLRPDPYDGQKAVIFYDCFKLFGETFLSLAKREPNDATMLRYTLYIEKQEKFIKGLTVWVAGDAKLYKPKEIVVEPEETEEEKEARLDELLADLNSLTGLTSVKHQVNSLVNLIKVQKMREANGLKTSDVSKHMVFMGNPGTGKTTVARKLAEIYKYLGVLEKGQLVEVDRSGLVKGYVGQTATQTAEVVDKALGGVLFVDEAYSLTVNKGPGDFGQEAVDTLLKAMEDHRKELIVIVAGYTDLMDEFLESNPGLRSRFSNFILFEDYTSEELLDILHKNLSSQDYSLSEEAEAKAKTMIEERVANKPANFANARDIRNYMEHAISNQANRMVKLEADKVTKEMLKTIEACDLQEFE